MLRVPSHIPPRNGPSNDIALVKIVGMGGSTVTGLGVYQRKKDLSDTQSLNTTVGEVAEGQVSLVGGIWVKKWLSLYEHYFSTTHKHQLLGQ